MFSVPEDLHDEELTALLETVHESGTELEPKPVAEAPIMTQRVPAVPEEPIDADEDDGTNSALQSLISKFNVVAQESLDNFAEDRREIEQALQVIWDDLGEAISEGKKRPQAIYQAYVELIKTKTNNNANVTKLLDSIARLLQAGRQNEIFSGINSSDGMSDKELTDLLED